jgi:hypothetical protein
VAKHNPHKHHFPRDHRWPKITHRPHRPFRIPPRRQTANDCTLSGNSDGTGGDAVLGLSGGGGGMYNAGSFSLTACIIAHNYGGPGGTGGNSSLSSEPGGNGGAGGSGGGIFNAADNFSADLRNSLVELNLVGAGGAGGLSPSPIPSNPQTYVQTGSPGADGSDPNLYGSFTTEGLHLRGAKADQFGTIAAPIDPLLGPTGRKSLAHGEASSRALPWELGREGALRLPRRPFPSAPAGAIPERTDRHPHCPTNRPIQAPLALGRSAELLLCSVLFFMFERS